MQEFNAQRKAEQRAARRAAVAGFARRYGVQVFVTASAVTVMTTSFVSLAQVPEDMPPVAVSRPRVDVLRQTVQTAIPPAVTAAVPLPKVRQVYGSHITNQRVAEAR